MNDKFDSWFWMFVVAVAAACVLKGIDVTASHADSLANCEAMCGGRPARFVAPARSLRSECICIEATDGGR